MTERMFCLRAGVAGKGPIASLGKLVAIYGAGLCVLTVAAQPYTPMKWTRYVQVPGQGEPVPEQWLHDEEARIAHSLVLPSGVPQPVPYSFKTSLFGEGPSIFSSHRERAIAYFEHLCRTEAGQWIFKTVQNVEGFYFARPRGRDKPSSDLMADVHGPEMPWIEREFMLKGDSLHIEGVTFVEPPALNYRFVEQPRRDAPWQAHIKTPYIRLFGYTTEPRLDPRGNPTLSFKEKTPMRVLGIEAPTAAYGYTWRGLKRRHDREHGIAGGELLIYDLRSKEVLAVKRQFVLSLGNRRTGDRAAWEVAASCPKLASTSVGLEFTYFAMDVLGTVEKTTLRRKE